MALNADGGLTRSLSISNQKSAFALIQVALSRSARVVDIHHLQLGIEVDRHASHLPKSDAGRFHAAERYVCFAADSGRVHVENAGIETIDELEHRCDVVGVDGRREPETNVVRHRE